MTKVICLDDRSPVSDIYFESYLTGSRKSDCHEGILLLKQSQE